MKHKYYRWLFERFGIQKKSVEYLYPEIAEWNIGDKFEFNVISSKFFSHNYCYLKSMSSDGGVLVSSVLINKTQEVLELYSIKQFVYNTKNISLADRKNTETVAKALNTDNILNQ